VRSCLIASGVFLLALGVGRAVSGCELAFPTRTDDGDASASDAGVDAPDDGDAVACDPVDPSTAAPVDAACTTPDASSCKPAPVPGFTPRWVPPRTPRATCSAAQIKAFYDGCYSPNATPGTCDAFGATNIPCYACLTSTWTDGQYGPLVVAAPTYYLNTAGCIALLDPCNLPCAKVLLGETACAIASCAGCTTPDGTIVDACHHDSLGCTCGDLHAQAGNCADTLLANGSPAAGCLAAVTFEVALERIGAIFCGGG